MLDGGAVTAVLTVVAGIVTGALSAAFGIGGAVVSTPAIRLLGVSAALAVGTTLPSILPAAVSGTVRYARAGLVRWDVVLWTVGPGAPAAVAGARLSRAVPGDGHALMVVTALLLGVGAARMARAGAKPAVPPIPVGVSVDRRLVAAVGTAAGLLSGLLGVGGGIVMVPAFSEVLRLRLKSAIATSLACVGLLAVPATLTHWALGGIDWATAALLSLGVVPGARLGAAVATRATERHLRITVAAVLGVTAVVYLVTELAALAA
ncbi:MAG: sulfite exporter TauE/SafE family protein [Acidimicrobiales bacterium]